MDHKTLLFLLRFPSVCTARPRQSHHLSYLVISPALSLLRNVGRSLRAHDEAPLASHALRQRDGTAPLRRVRVSSEMGSGRKVNLPKSPPVTVLCTHTPLSPSSFFPTSGPAATRHWPPWPPPRSSSWAPGASAAKCSKTSPSRASATSTSSTWTRLTSPT